MFSRTALIDLYRHMKWADGEVWRAVMACEAAHGDATLTGLLLHLHTVQRAFLDIWTGQQPVFPEAAAFPSPADLRAWGEAYYPRVFAYLESLPGDELRRSVVMPWAAYIAQEIGREPAPATLGETIFQVSSHSTYHRAQINARLRALGGTPPLVDYIAWIWFERPEAVAAGTTTGSRVT
jgi:uncharacterized damage-inducible protein DinB